jgi:hypothetical protein
VSLGELAEAEHPRGPGLVGARLGLAIISCSGIAASGNSGVPSTNALPEKLSCTPDGIRDRVEAVDGGQAAEDGCPATGLRRTCP